MFGRKYLWSPCGHGKSIVRVRDAKRKPFVCEQCGTRFGAKQLCRLNAPAKLKRAVVEKSNGCSWTKLFGQGTMK